MYAVWLQRNRAFYDEDITAFTIPAVCAVAKQRILRATTTLSSISFLQTHHFGEKITSLHKQL